MEKYKIIFVILGIAIVVLGSTMIWSFTSLRYFFGSDIVLEPSMKLVENIQTLKAVKSFLAKYPDTKVLYDIDAKTVDYRSGIPSNRADLEVNPYIRLRILVSSEGLPDEIFVECWDGKESHISNGDDNVVAYLQKKTCLDEIK
ncbi:MAG: hypothetical protein ACREAE_10490 [Nitrosopumilaceae archaeon]